MPTVIVINANGAVDRSLTLSDIAAHTDQTDELIWIDFVGSPTQAELDTLRTTFLLSDRVLSHLTRTHRGPRAVRFLLCRLVVIYDVALDARSGEVETSEIVLLIGDRFLITTHPAASNVIPLATEQIEVQLVNYGFSVAAVALSILDALLDRYDAVVTQVQGEVEALRHRILGQQEAQGVDDVYRLTKKLGDLRQVMAPEEQLLTSIHSPNSSSETPELSDAFQDVSIDLQSAIGNIDQSTALVSNLLDTYESLKSDALNDLVKRLTVLSIMVALIAIVPAVLGISLNTSPFRNGYQGYLVSLLLMLLLGLLIWAVARRIGWLK